ncbi:MAG TPA: AMP-binding protein [Solirubrobacterales bacterium]
MVIGVPKQLGETAGMLRALVATGVIRPGRPDHLPRLAISLRRWGRSPAAGIAALAALYGDEPYVIDELGTLSFGEVERRTNALASSLAEGGVGPGDVVALMCRNHRGFIDAALACSKLGADCVLLNTDFAGPQLAGVIERERPAAVICDQEFEPLLAGGAGAGDVPRFLGWIDQPGSAPSLEQLIAAGDPSPPNPPAEPGRLTILSSGTTGTPKGVQREGDGSLAPLLGYMERVGLRARETQVIAAPMFHGWGLLHLGVSLLLGTPVVLRRRFDPEATLESIARHRAATASLVPVMLQRIVDLDPEVRRRHDTRSLRAVTLGGSALPGELAIRAMDALGDVVFNTYGSTEVALATTATPADLRAAPATAGRPLPATEVRILDAGGRALPAGEPGRIFVGSELAASGYTGGGGKQVIDGFTSSGDLGHFDAEGRLYIDGREDDMIVSGGENVFPGEVEDLLANHPAIAEAAVIGVGDDDFGQRLCAYVVVREGAELDADGVRGHVKANLARYKVPRDVEFIAALPRNPTGKVLKRELGTGSGTR